ncbi:MAG: DUF4132 domain-containing protein [Phycisphaera sp.]|nr:DUF4132 domain-containing protein [Phycisphaera sp.]
MEFNADYNRERRLSDLKAGVALLSGDDDARSAAFLAILEREFAYTAKLGERAPYPQTRWFGYGTAQRALIELMDEGVVLDRVLLPALRYLAAHFNFYYMTAITARLIAEVRQRYGPSMPEEIRDVLTLIRGQLTGGGGLGGDRVALSSLDELLGDGLWKLIDPCEVWTHHATEQINTMTDEQRDAWVAILTHCRTAKSAKPAAKWTNAALPLIERIGAATFQSHLLEWFSLVDKARRHRTIGSAWDNTDDTQRMHDTNADVLRGLIWACLQIPSRDICRSITTVALSAYRKARGIGPRAVKVGNACVWALGEMPGLEGVAQLALVNVRVKYKPAQKGIEKALEKTAERLGIGPDEVEEMCVPEYGMTEVGLRREQLGDFTAEVAVTATNKAELRWFKPDGKPQKSMPKAVKDEHGEEVKELKQAAKDIEKMLPAQRDRIDRMFLQPRSWPMPRWRERYLDHPLVGVIARKLIWRFTRGGQTADAIWRDGRFVTVDDQPVDWLDGAGDDVTVALWHPIEHDPDVITAWRDWLDRHEVRQPIKQAYREVYLLTDAERNTGVYSNRYAAHVIKQHQFNALCAIRGWRNTLRLMVDDSYPPTSRALPEWNLRAEFWVEGAGDEYGRDTNETGTYLYLATDQVRFYRIDAAERYAHASGGQYTTNAEGPGTDNVNEPLPLTDIPPLVFSEVMRDVDLFVGVCSVGNDPTWNDGGPEGRYHDYWQNFSFGELAETAQTRKAVLERIVPRLKIAGRCSFSDRFLVVKGDVRTYKIHLGSGNILMEPNDQYLCIVPNQTVADRSTESVFLPFEGDRTLAVILSKALLLADDKKIKDKTILSQIGR